MIGPRLPRLVACALSMSACADTETVSVRISTDRDSCLTASAEDVPLPCRGSVGVWLVSEEPAILDERCVAFGPERTAVSDVAAVLADGGVTFAVDTGEPLALELAVYPEEAGGCPRPGIVGAGPQESELASWERMGALHFGRSESRSLAETAEIAVTIACLEGASGCEPPDPAPDAGGEHVDVTAEVVDLESNTPAAPDVVAQVELAALEGNDAALELERLLSLRGENPFVGTLEARLPDTPCLATLVTDSQGLEFLSCEVQRSTDEFVEAVGYRARFDLLVDLFGAEEVGEHLQHGFVVGRVVSDAEDERISVKPLDPGYEVLREGAWFLAHRGDDTPDCCARFAVEAPELFVETQPVPVLPGLISTVAAGE